MREFSVRAVGASVEVGVYTIGAAENPDGTGLLFQRSLGPEEEGLDEDAPSDEDGAYCLVEHPSQACAYDCIVSWGLKSRVLVIRVTPAVEKDFKLSGGYLLQLEVDDASIQTLEHGLQRVLVGVPRDDTIVDATEG